MGPRLPFALLFAFAIGSGLSAQQPKLPTSDLQAVIDQATLEARQKAGSKAKGSVDVLLEQARESLRTAAVARIPSSGSRPSPTIREGIKLYPDGLAVRVYGDVPDTGFCVRYFEPGRHLIDWPCNDQVSGADVPFGLQLKICENDGQGSWGLGQCADFPPGNSFVGKLSDKGTYFDVTDQMSVYYSTDAEEVPANPDFDISVTKTDNGYKLNVHLWDSQDWFSKDYSVPVPPNCHVQTWETTKANNARWSSEVKDGVLTIHMSVMRRPTAGKRNWVGVGFRCG